MNASKRRFDHRSGWMRSPFIIDALKDERLFSDNYCQWENSPSFAVAEVEAAATVRSLRRVKRRKNAEDYRTLADVLGRCRPDHRCGNGACAMCRRAAQLFYVARAAGLSGYRGRVQELAWITIVLERDAVPIGGLGGFDRDACAVTLSRILLRAPLTRALGSLDISLNEFPAKGKRFWQPHFHMIGQTESVRMLRRRLTEIVGDQVGYILSPTWVAPCDGSRKVWSYSNKWRFNRHIRIEAEGKKHSTWKPWIRHGSNYSELMLFLAQVGLSGRILQRGRHQVRIFDDHFPPQHVPEGGCSLFNVITYESIWLDELSY